MKSTEKKPIRIHVDASYSTSDGTAGVAFIAPGKISSLRLNNIRHVKRDGMHGTDIQRLEMFAILRAARYAKRAFRNNKIVIFCDNYCVCTAFWPWKNNTNPRIVSMRNLVRKILKDNDFRIVFMRGHRPAHTKKAVLHRMTDSLAKEARNG